MFTSLGPAQRNRIGRLNNTVAASQSFTSSVNGTSLEWLRSQASPEVNRVTFELFQDGFTYSPLGTASRIPGGWQLTGLALLPHQNL